MNGVVVFGNLEVVGLAPREAETLAHTARGLSAKEAARAMGISPRTVEMNLNHSMLRLSAKNRAQLVHEAWMRGMLRAAVCLIFALATMTPDEDHEFLQRTSRTVRIRRVEEEELNPLHDFT